MGRDQEREARSLQDPIVGGLPDVPGILAAMRLAPGLTLHLRGLADELLVKEFPGTTLTRAERELIATAVSAANGCFYCMDSHGAFASELLRRASAPVFTDPAFTDLVLTHTSPGGQRTNRLHPVESACSVDALVPVGRPLHAMPAKAEKAEKLSAARSRARG
jgi:AhpD family alkylhydroperoxidase